MAECSYARCVQERRAIKKELQRWTKNMVFVVGLERVAEELMGRRKWRQYQDVFLRSRLTAEAEPETSDWEPQDKCCFCDGGSFLGSAPSPASDSGSSTNSRSSCRETPPASSDGQSSSAAHVSLSPSTMTTLESVTSITASLAAVAALSVNSTNVSSASSGASANPSSAAMSIFPPTTPHTGLFPHWYMSPPPPHLAPNLSLDRVPPASKQESPIPAMVMSLPASTASEQPLDLSAKATSCMTPPVDNSTVLCARSPTPDPSLKVPSVIDKHIFKAKPRMSAVAGRRQYTEEELQAALRDIQSGKLGTRRAAVIYGIPRSTLRNKVYKLAMERERDMQLNPIALVDKALLPPVVALKDEEDGKEEDEDEKELSGAEEEREVEKALRKPLLSMEDLVRFSMLEGMTAESLRALLQHGKFLEDKRGIIERDDGTPSPTLPTFPSTADFWQNLEHSALGPFISQMLANSGGQNRDLSSVIGNKNPEGGISTTPRENSPTNIASDFLPKFSSPLLPELVRRMMAEDEQVRKSRTVAHSAEVNFLVNGAHSDENFSKSEEKGKVGKPMGLLSPCVITRSDMSKADAEESSDADASATSGPSGMATPPNVILKIPSFKPTSKNGVAASGTPGLPSETLPFTHGAFPHSSLTPESSHHLSMSVPLGSGGSRSNHSDSCSPPIPNLSGKGIGVSLRDVIAKSISQKFQQQGADISHLPLSQKLLLPGDGGDQPPYKRGRFTPPVGCNPSAIAASVIKHNNNNTHSDDKNKTNTPSSKPATSGTSTSTTTSGGKGTRPKRGKYRNYDRDSLVEAVRAVQRGEMSVHRAGSYYGVPHSTLEYKVKERHLMRPRKRDQKAQMDGVKPKEENIKNTPPATTASVAVTPSITVAATDKLKTPPKPHKPSFTPSSPLPTAPNGLKIPPLFDPSLSHLAYTTPPPFPFWPPSPFHASLPLPDFARSGSASSGFNPGSEHFFASQMMQRLQEESSRVHGNSSPGVSSAVRSPPVVNPSNTLGKSAREMAESLYDGTGANGSFLDGIIRSSLEMGLPPGTLKDGVNNATSEKITAPENLSNKALLDQLCRNSRLAPLPRPSTQSHNSSDDESLKQPSECGSTRSTAEVCSAAVVDLSSATSSQTEGEKKPVVEEVGLKSPKPDNTKEKSSDDEDDVKPLSSKEANGLSNLKDDPNDNVSACDSMSNLKRVSDIDAAKDLQQEEGGSDDPETQDTKSNKINS
ncbi:hypothetical protein R5R35_010229 [Gryllus longicercus]|uniref:HTH psq-type domain-containing protein n=1 Tax=Gryllus longicercus TaxID=2509291 RepID=A0AAN9Z7S1_9ORTH